MGEILDFPGRRHDRARDDAAQALRRERAAALREALDRNPAMGREDQILVAEALWRLLDRAERGSGIRKDRILREAGIGGADNPRKHLAQYALSPSVSSERRTKARLTKRPRPLLKIADAAARLAGWSVDETLLEVFDASSISAANSPRQAAPEFEELASHLRSIADTIAGKHDLQAYFRAVARAQVSLAVDEHAMDLLDDKSEADIEPDEIELGFQERSGLLDWPISFRQRSEDKDYHDDLGTVPPYPSVILGDWEVGEQFPIGVASDTCPQEGEYGPSPFGGEAVGQYSAEIRFCIVPFGPEMQALPALRITPELTILPLRAEAALPDAYRSPDGSFETLFDDPTEIIRFDNYDTLPTGKPVSVEATVIATGRRVRCLLTCDAAVVPAIISSTFDLSRIDLFGLQVPRQRCVFLPVYGTVCTDWLSGSASSQTWYASDKTMHVRALGPPVLHNRDGSGFSVFQAGTIAAALDRCLSGKEGPDLIAMLDERAGRFKKLLAQAQGGAEQARERGYARLQARLRTMSGEAG